MYIYYYSLQNCKNVPQKICAGDVIKPNCVEKTIGQECRNESREMPHRSCSTVPQEVCQNVTNEICKPVLRNNCAIVPVEIEVEKCKLQPR